jgi:hypothetical protein
MPNMAVAITMASSTIPWISTRLAGRVAEAARSAH